MACSSISPKALLAAGGETCQGAMDAMLAAVLAACPDEAPKPGQRVVAVTPRGVAIEFDALHFWEECILPSCGIKRTRLRRKRLDSTVLVALPEPRT